MTVVHGYEMTAIGTTLPLTITGGHHFTNQTLYCKIEGLEIKPQNASSPLPAAGSLTVFGVYLSPSSEIMAPSCFDTCPLVTGGPLPGRRDRQLAREERHGALHLH